MLEGVGQGKVALDVVQSSVHIWLMQAVSYSEARENLKSMIDKVVADRAPLAITRQRGEGAVLISASEWASIEETLYLLSSPANAKRLMEGIARLDAGEGEEHELITP
jgi:antitoxin YefM